MGCKIDPAELAGWIRRYRGMLLDDETTARGLNQGGIECTTGQPWTAADVRAVLEAKP